MSRDIQLHDEIDVVVERRGYGANVWQWRLSNGLNDLARSNGSFRCAEDAYREGKANLLALRASSAHLSRRPMELDFAEEVESFDLAAEA